MTTRTLLSFLCIIALGCGSGQHPLGQVKGTVTFDGKPLAKGTIRFEAPGKRPATGNVINGQIVEMTTYTTADGAPVGSHKVAVWASEEAASAVAANPGDGKIGANYMSGKSLIPAKYNDPATSELTAEVKSGENVVEFKLKKQP